MKKQYKFVEILNGSFMLTAFLVVATYSLSLGQRKPVQVETSSRKLSETRTLMNKTDIVRINKDWSLVAEFKSGSGEKIEFFPVEVIDQHTGVKMIALQVDLKIKTPSGGTGFMGAMSGMASGGLQSLASSAGQLAAAMANDGVVSAWIDHDEIARMIEFIEKEVAPNIDKKYKKKSSEFIFQSQELTMRYLIDEDRKRISILLNGGEGNTNAYFYTENRADKIGEILPILKRVLSKELQFN
jgi:hypothetical protein